MYLLVSPCVGSFVISLSSEDWGRDRSGWSSDRPSLDTPNSRPDSNAVVSKRLWALTAMARSALAAIAERGGFGGIRSWRPTKKVELGR